MLRLLQFVLFISVMLTVTFAVHYYFIKRISRDTALPNHWPRFLRRALIALWAVSVISFGAGRFLPLEVGKRVIMGPYIWMGLVPLLFFSLLLFDLLRLFLWLYRRGVQKRPVDTGRRRFFSRIGAGVSSLATIGMGTAAVATALESPMVKKIEVTLAKLPSGLDGFRIVQLTDLHIGLTLGKSWLRRVVAEVGVLDPDLVAITGDLVDGSPDRLRHHVEELRALRAKFGVFFVTGNHEYYSGAPEWIGEIQRLGIRVLRNETVVVSVGTDSFELAGVDDYSARRILDDHGPDYDKALKDRDPSREVILLAHQPRAVFEAAERGIGLVISGHTHGGQIWPLTYFVGLQQPYSKGLHRHGETTQIYVSEGTGYWGPPMRLGTTGEITEITLRSKGKTA